MKIFDEIKKTLANYERLRGWTVLPDFPAGTELPDRFIQLAINGREVLTIDNGANAPSTYSCVLNVGGRVYGDRRITRDELEAVADLLYSEIFAAGRNSNLAASVQGVVVTEPLTRQGNETHLVLSATFTLFT